MLRERNQSPLRWVMIKLIAPYNKLSWLRQAQKCYKADDGTTAAVAAWDALPGNIHSLLQHLQQQHRLNRISLICSSQEKTVSISYNSSPGLRKKLSKTPALICSSHPLALLLAFRLSDWFASLAFHFLRLICFAWNRLGRRSRSCRTIITSWCSSAGTLSSGCCFWNWANTGLEPLLLVKNT